MDIVMWVLAGGALGWVCFKYWGLNEDRGLPASMVIGGAGGFLGGKLAPAFTNVPTDELSIVTLIFAGVAALACLAAASVVHARWGV